MNKFATQSINKNVTQSRNNNVRPGLRGFVKLLSQVMVEQVVPKLATVVAVLPVDMVQLRLQSAEMFPRKSVARFPDNNAEMCHNRNVRVFQDNSVAMFPVNNVTQFPARCSVRIVPTAHRNNVLMCQWKSARMFHVPCAEMFQPRHAEMFPEKFQETSAKRENLKSVTLLRTKTAERSPRNSVKLSQLRSAIQLRRNSVGMSLSISVRTLPDRFLDKSVRVSQPTSAQSSPTWSAPMSTNSCVLWYHRRTAEENPSSSVAVFQDNSVARYQDSSVRNNCQVMAGRLMCPLSKYSLFSFYKIVDMIFIYLF